MQKIIILFSIACTLTLATAHAQRQGVKRKGVTPVNVGNKPETKFTYDYKLEQFKGKWQEVKRNYKNNNPAPVTDTIFLYFKDDNKVETKDGSKTYIKGEAAIEAPGNILVAAADIYTIVSVSNDMIVLDDGDEFIHTLKKVNRFWSETVGKDPVSQEAFDNPIHASAPNLVGNWAVYRRQAAPGAVEANTMLIKHLKIKEATSEHTATGEITCYTNEKSETLPCTVTINGSAIDISTATYKWNFPVYKADGKELVFGTKGKLLYFAKPL
jgi:hypothetical protein